MLVCRVVHVINFLRRDRWITWSDCTLFAHCTLSAATVQFVAELHATNWHSFHTCMRPGHLSKAISLASSCNVSLTSSRCTRIVSSGVHEAIVVSKFRARLGYYTASLDCSSRPVLRKWAIYADGISFYPLLGHAVPFKCASEGARCRRRRTRARKGTCEGDSGGRRFGRGRT